MMPPPADPLARPAACPSGRELVGGGEDRAREPLLLSAKFGFLPAEQPAVEPGARDHLVRYDQLALIALGQGFEAAGGVDGVADRGQRRRGAITHLADNRRPGMDADADAQG